jgi:hypothetical protein
MAVIRKKRRVAIDLVTGSYILLILLGRGRCGVEGVDRVKGIGMDPTLSKLGRKYHHH